MNQEYLEYAHSFLSGLREYHRHEVVGMEHVPEKGPVIVAVNHSLATYDIALLLCAIYDQTGRIARPLADRWFFRLPYVSELMNKMGVVEGNHKSAEKLLKEGELLSVAPGGMREALRPSDQRYQILWEKRKGFAKLALRTGAPVILAMCPKADDVFDVFPNPLTKWAYQKFRVPLILARGFGPTPIPRPVKLIHFLSDPMKPPVLSTDPVEFEKQLNQFHAKLVKKAKQLIGEAIAYRSES